MPHLFVEGVFALTEIGRFSHILITNGNKSFWSAQFLLLFQVAQNRLTLDEQWVAAVRCFEETPPPDKVDKISHWAPLKWAVENAVDQSFRFNSASADTVEVLAWYGFARLFFIISLHHRVW